MAVVMMMGQRSVEMAEEAKLVNHKAAAVMDQGPMVLPLEVLTVEASIINIMGPPMEVKETWQEKAAMEIDVVT